MADRPRVVVPGRFAVNRNAARPRRVSASRAVLAALYAAGAEPLVVLPHSLGRIDPEAVAERFTFAEGVLLPGGGDLAGHWSGQPHHHLLQDVDEEQDGFDLAVARWALRAGLPTLAICRGAQVVNVAFGGTLVQDMDAAPDETLHHHRNHLHRIETVPGTTIARAVGDRLEVSCYHHQCIDVLGTGLTATAYSEEGVIEAIEAPGLPGWFLGTQWHPEDTWETQPAQRAVFGGFVGACLAAR